MNNDTQSQFENIDQFYIPESFLTDHLSKINDPDLFKLLLYIFWRFDKSRSPIKFITAENILTDEIFSENFGKTRDEITQHVNKLFTPCSGR